MEDIQYKTLILRFSSVGDIVLSSLLVRALRQRLPTCRIDYVVKSEFAELVAHNPHISRVIPFPARGTFGDLRALRRSIRPSSYDLVIDIHDSLRSRYLSWGAREVVRINKRKFARWVLVHLKRNTYSRFGGAPSVALRYLEPLARWNVADDAKGLELFIPPSSFDTATRMLSDAGVAPVLPLVGVCPSAHHATKMWLPERFAEAAAHIAEEHGAGIVLLGSEDEHARCEGIRSSIKSRNPGLAVVNLAGRSSLLETAAIIDRCLLVLTNDTGLMHIASARKRKVVAIFGSTVREFGFFPFGTISAVAEVPALPCRPCTHIGRAECPEGHFRCMNDVQTSHVLDHARHIVAMDQPL
jgi:lipopolysaccharide heptosyltransferase II